MSPGSTEGSARAQRSAKSLVELHHGSIRAESAGPGHGSTFIVELPGQAAQLPVKRPVSL